MERRDESENIGNLRKNGICEGIALRKDRNNVWQSVDGIGQHRKSTFSI